MIVKITFVESRVYVASLDLTPEEHAALRHGGLPKLVNSTRSWRGIDEIVERLIRTPISMEPR